MLVANGHRAAVDARWRIPASRHAHRALTAVPKQDVERDIHLVDRDGVVHRGPAAILKIAEQYPRLQPLARAARTPPVWMFAPAVYRFVAANRRFLLGPESRLYWLKAAVLVTLCLELAMSSPLWIGPRTYPLSPLIEALPALPAVVADVLYAATFLLAAGALAVARPQRWLAALLGVMAVFCLLDQTRWQAWIFQLVFLLAGLSLYSWNSADTAGRDRCLNTARFIVAATYVYSGLQKINPHFMDVDFPWIVQPISSVAPQAAGALHVLGMIAPFLQVGFGAGLLVPGLRRVSLVAAVAMHLFILAMLGPFGQDWNDIVWPWTAAMAVFDLLLFGGRPQAGAREIVWPGRSVFPLVARVCFGVLPALSFFNLWDSAPSSALYSGNVTEAQIYVNDAGARALPPAISRRLVHTSADTNVLNLQRWSIEELNVVPYSETRVFKRIARSLCDELPDPSDLALNVRETRLFFSRPETDYGCPELQSD